MTRAEIVQQLHSLAANQRDFVDKQDPACIFRRDCDALEQAARIIEGLGETPINRVKAAARRGWRRLASALQEKRRCRR